MNTKKPYFHQKNPFRVPVQDGKIILEHFGRASTGETGLSLAHMKAPPGWSEPFQVPEFDEYTLVIRGRKRVVSDGSVVDLSTGESILIRKGSKVQYSNPFESECEYVSVCVPAFWPEGAHRLPDQKN